jgi:hypothetical protein
MRKAILMMILAVVSSGSTAAEWTQEWRTCVKDADCVILWNPCAKDIEKTVNKKFEDDANRYLARVNATKNCVESCMQQPDGKCKQPVAKCVDAKCILSK